MSLVSCVGGPGSAGSSCAIVVGSGVGGLAVGRGSVSSVTSFEVSAVVVRPGEWGWGSYWMVVSLSSIAGGSTCRSVLSTGVVIFDDMG